MRGHDLYSNDHNNPPFGCPIRCSASLFCGEGGRGEDYIELFCRKRIML